MTHDAIDHLVEQWHRERPELDVSPTAVLQRITRVHVLQSASFTEVFARHGLTFGEFEVLAALRRSGRPWRMKPTELYGALVLSSGATTNRIDRLEAAGLVERIPDPDDRRGTLVGLTPRGRRTLDAATADHLANEERLLEALSPRDRDQLVRLLRKLLVSAPFTALDPARPRGARRGRTGRAVVRGRGSATRSRPA